MMIYHYRLDRAQALQIWAPRLLVACATLFALSALPYGWYPHDEGQLGQTAERILQGELPHRDFVDPYTGGLGFWNALGFQIAGPHSMVLRWQLVPWFVLFAGCCYWIARRVATRWESALAASVCVVTTLPVYSAAMPSWYNLFCAVFGVTALMKGEGARRREWLFVAGWCGGLSILFKIVGLFYVGAGLLYLLFRDAASAEPPGNAPRASRVPWVTGLVVAALVMGSGLGLQFLSPTDRWGTLLQLVGPFWGVVGVAIVREIRQGDRAGRIRVARLWNEVLPFLAGAACLPLLWGAWYAWEGALGSLVDGVFLLPRKRITDAAMAFPTDERWVSMVLFAAPFAWEMWLAYRQVRWQRWLSGSYLLLCAAMAVWRGTVMGFVEPEAIVHFVPPFMVGVLVYLAVKQWRRDRTAAGTRGLFLLVAVAAFHGLIQFPHAAFIYFCYAAPLYVLAGLYWYKSVQAPPRWTTLALAVSLLVTFVAHYRHYSSTLPPLVGRPAVVAGSLALPRSNLCVYRSDAELYNGLIPFLQRLTGDSEAVLAFPDCPEVTFLSGRPNPSPLMYEFLAPDPGRQVSFLRVLLQLDEVRVVVFNHTNAFDPATRRGWLHEILARHPHHKTFEARDTVVRDRFFTVFWREPSVSPP